MNDDEEFEIEIIEIINGIAIEHVVLKHRRRDKEKHGTLSLHDWQIIKNLIETDD